MKSPHGHRSRSSEDERETGTAATHHRDHRPGVQGRVRDETGAPVPGAFVAISSATGEVRDIAVVSGPGGEFELPPLSPGEYVVQAHTPHGEGHRAFRSGPEATLNVEIVIKPVQG